MVEPLLPDNNARAQLYWVDNSTLGIHWSDGQESRHPLEDLRARCPCALCKAIQANPLAVQRRPQGEHLQALEVQPVGRYAIQITWSDGHRTGIYTYEFLKQFGVDNLP